MLSFAPKARWCWLAVLAGALCALPPKAQAQHGGGGSGGRGSHGAMGPMGSPSAMGSEGSMGPMGGPGEPGFGGRRGGPPPNAGGNPEAAATTSTMRGGLQLGPPGRWWDDKHFAKSLQLRPDQQQHMDATFEANRGALLHRYEDLQGEQNRMEGLVHAKSLDEGALFAQIDRVAQARAELEKAMTHFLLQIRGEMDPDQISRLDQHR